MEEQDAGITHRTGSHRHPIDLEVIRHRSVDDQQIRPKASGGEGRRVAFEHNDVKPDESHPE
jgi:hypothetical protein